MKTKQIAIHICMLATLLLALSAHAQFQWANRIASITNWPEGEPNIGLALDTNDNCYVTGYFDGTNDFGGVTLTNQSVGGSDIFVAKYNSTGALQWVATRGRRVPATLITDAGLAWIPTGMFMSRAVIKVRRISAASICRHFRRTILPRQI